MKIAYFVHDLSDPAVRRRVLMFRAGGAEVVLVGFRRGAAPIPEVAGAPAHDLGQTHNARLAHRAATTVMQRLAAGRWREVVADADAVVARNLEVLWIAEAARRAGAPRARLVYECLDIHRLMASDGAPGKILRGLEHRLLDVCDLLILSSPAFEREYFRPRHALGVPTLLVENKLLRLDGDDARPVLTRAPGPPWRIGWFGALRCRKSLALLTELAARHPGLVEVVLRGRPAYDEFDDFDAQVAAAPGVSYLGPYVAEDLPALYGDVHFTWAVDFYEEGLNSSWLLPNRVYEGGYFGAPALGLRGVETGRWIAAHGSGVVFDDMATEVGPFLQGLDADGYARLARQLQQAPRDLFACDARACRALVDAVAGRAASAPA